MYSRWLMALSTLLLSALGCSKAPIRTFTAASRGVAYSVAVNGTRSDLLSKDSTEPGTVGLPSNMAEFEVKRGANVMVVSVDRVDPSASPSLRLDVQESQPGEIVDTMAAGKSGAPFPIVLEGDGLVAGARHEYSFELR